MITCGRFGLIYFAKWTMLVYKTQPPSPLHNPVLFSTYIKNHTSPDTYHHKNVFLILKLKYMFTYINMLTWWNDLHVTSKNTRVLNIGWIVFTTSWGWPLSEKQYVTTNNVHYEFKPYTQTSQMYMIACLCDVHHSMLTCC